MFCGVNSMYANVGVPIRAEWAKWTKRWLFKAIQNKKKINRYSFTDNQSVRLCFVCELCQLGRQQYLDLDATTINFVLNRWFRLLCIFIICMDVTLNIQCHHNNVIVVCYAICLLSSVPNWMRVLSSVLQNVNLIKCQCYRALHKTHFPPSLTTALYFE